MTRSRNDATSGDVLVVDDDLAIVEMITDALMGAGYRVRRVFNGAEGLMAIAFDLPALVLLDLQMPYLSGGEVLAQVRAAHPYLPIVLITAQPEHAAPLAERYQVGYIAKPFELSTLLDCVAQHVPHSRTANGDGLNF